MCMYVHICIYIYIDLHIYTHTRTHTHNHSHTNTRFHRYIWIHTHKSYVRTHARRLTHMHIYTNIYTHPHTSILINKLHAQQHSACSQRTTRTATHTQASTYDIDVPGKRMCMWVCERESMCVCVSYCEIRWTWSASDVVLQCVAVCCSVLQCVAVCCSVLQCVADKSTSQADEDEVQREIAQEHK